MGFLEGLTNSKYVCREPKQVFEDWQTVCQFLLHIQSVLKKQLLSEAAIYLYSQKKFNTNFTTQTVASHKC